MHGLRDGHEVDAGGRLPRSFRRRHLEAHIAALRLRGRQLLGARILRDHGAVPLRKLRGSLPASCGRGPRSCERRALSPDWPQSFRVAPDSARIRGICNGELCGARLGGSACSAGQLTQLRWGRREGAPVATSSARFSCGGPAYAYIASTSSLE